MFFFDSGAEENTGYIDKGTAYNYFRILLKESEIDHCRKGNGPRLHELRDSFAVHSLQNLNEFGEDVNSLLEYLSLYLGHHSIYETQDYLWLTENLAAEMLKKNSGDTLFFSEEFKRKVVDDHV